MNIFGFAVLSTAQDQKSSPETSKNYHRKFTTLINTFLDIPIVASANFRKLNQEYGIESEYMAAGFSLPFKFMYQPDSLLESGYTALFSDDTSGRWAAHTTTFGDSKEARVIGAGVSSNTNFIDLVASLSLEPTADIPFYVKLYDNLVRRGGESVSDGMSLLAPNSVILYSCDKPLYLSFVSIRFNTYLIWSNRSIADRINTINHVSDPNNFKLWINYYEHKVENDLVKIDLTMLHKKIRKKWFNQRGKLWAASDIFCIVQSKLQRSGVRSLWESDKFSTYRKIQSS